MYDKRANKQTEQDVREQDDLVENHGCDKTYLIRIGI